MAGSRVTHQLGSATAAYGSGLVRTLLGNYNAAFFFAGSMCLAAALIVLWITAPPRPVFAEAAE
jgi:predicted MFS family arabinose efflux permease